MKYTIHLINGTELKCSAYLTNTTEYGIFITYHVGLPTDDFYNNPESIGMIPIHSINYISPILQTK